MENEALSLLSGFGAGVLASGAFWYILTRIQPKLTVAPRAAYDPLTKELHIKVINRGRKQVSEIRANLRLVERKGDGDELSMHTLEPITLYRDQVFGMGGKENFGRAWQLYPAWIFRAQDSERFIDKLEMTDSGERRLVFTLIGRHALTGTAKIIRTTFGLRNIEHGGYRTGNTFDIVSEPTRFPLSAITDADDSEEGA